MAWPAVLGAGNFLDEGVRLLFGDDTVIRVNHAGLETADDTPGAYIGNGEVMWQWRVVRLPRNRRAEGSVGFSMHGVVFEYACCVCGV